MKLKSVKLWNMVGIIAGVAIIVLGIVLACVPAESYTTQTNNKSVTFGADYYTYQYEASSNAAANAAAAANNLRQIGERLALYAGLLFVVIGLLTTIKYAKKYFLEEDFDLFEDDDLESFYEDEDLDMAELVVVDDEAGEPAEEAAQESAEEVLTEDVTI